MSQAAAAKAVTLLVLVKKDYVERDTLTNYQAEALKQFLLYLYPHFTFFLPSCLVVFPVPDAQLSDWVEKILESLLRHIR